jgi:hypothetical protein
MNLFLKFSNDLFIAKTKRIFHWYNNNNNNNSRFLYSALYICLSALMHGWYGSTLTDVYWEIIDREFYMYLYWTVLDLFTFILVGRLPWFTVLVIYKIKYIMKKYVTKTWFDVAGRFRKVVWRRSTGWHRSCGTNKNKLLR